MICLFQDDNTLISCGAGDGIIKVWDLRRNYSCYKKEPLPKHSIPYPGVSTFKGYTNLLIDSTGQKLFVNCMDHNIYCFNLGVYATQPMMNYVGLMNSTFYIKSSLSADGQYLISGSSDEKAYIWNVNNSQPLLSLNGHTVEVTCVAWSKTNDLRIVTCSDDARHKIWRLKCDNIDEDTSSNYGGTAETFKQVKRCHLKRRLKALENTPRTLKRIVEVNETTPSSTEKSSLKRSYNDMCCGDIQNTEAGDSKRQLIETRARRLFAPTTSTTASTSTASIINNNNNNNNTSNGNRNSLYDIGEELETPPKEESKLLSPLNERNHLNHYRLDEIRTPSSSNRPSCSQSLFSPTSNLPNYVIDGDAPHLKLQSPKRKCKENVDWLTKIRKQKLTSTISSQLNEKLNASSSQHDNQTISSVSHVDLLHQIESSSGILSPRMRKIKSSDRSAYGYGSPPQRRMSSCQSNSGDASEEITSMTTTPTRRKSETTILRFFCVTPTTQSRESSPASSNRSS